MAIVRKNCRVCGKSYEACRTANKIDGVFRWREVACSPECGVLYLSQIEESRKATSENSKDNDNYQENRITEKDSENSFTREDEDVYEKELNEYFDDEETNRNTD